MSRFPTTFIIFGITGDLAQKKILPALYDLYVTHRIEKDTRIVGFSRRDISVDEIRNFVLSAVNKENADKSFLDLVSYIQGNFDNPDSYKKLAEHLALLDNEQNGCSNKLFYLAVPPNLYEMIAVNLSGSGLSVPCGPDVSGGDGSFARILIEKPFGKDLLTAQKLDELLGFLFKEEQIFRIDHYIAKNSLYKIIDLHRRDEMVAQHWNREHIARVEINLFEKTPVGSRGASYDGIGAFRDVGQNHMLQMLSLVAMDLPAEKTAFAIQSARARVLESIVSASFDTSHIVRGQYDGYLSEPGVASGSQTETFFQITVYISVEKFKGVPFVLTSGKALEENKTEIIVHFIDGMKISFEVPPEDSQPAYQKILLDCVAGDQTVFISTAEILAEWAYVSPVVEMWGNIKPFVYSKGANPKNLL